MKRNFKILGLSLIFLFLFNICFARIIDEYNPSQPPLEVENKEFLYVILGKDGDAAISAKIHLENISTKEIKKIKIEIPGKNQRLINALQEIWEKGKREPSYAPLEWKEDKKKKGIYEFEFKKPIPSQGKSALLLYYKLKNVAQKRGGVWRFEIETIKIPYDLKKIRVAIDVEKGLYLKTEITPVFAKEIALFVPSALKSKEYLQEEVRPGHPLQKRLWNFSSRIEYASGKKVEEFENIDPQESVKVKGVFSTQRILLYFWESLVFFIILLLIGGVIYSKWKALKEEGKPTIGGEVVPLAFWSSVGIIVFSIFFSWGWEKILKIFPPKENLFNLLIFTTVVILTALSYLFFFLYPSVSIIKRKKRFLYGILTFILILIFVIFFGILIGSFGYFEPYPGPGPIYYKYLD